MSGSLATSSTRKPSGTVIFAEPLRRVRLVGRMVLAVRDDIVGRTADGSWR